MKHPFDPRTQVGVEQALWHGDPILERLVCDVFERYQPDCFIETGSHLGWTSHWVATNYPSVRVYTVETDPEFFGRAYENLGGLPNAFITLDDSVNWLWKLRDTLKTRRPLFWLDAHWHPPVPLREECRIVSTLPTYVCLVDDFACWDPQFGGDTFYSRHSLDYTKSGADGGGDAYLNDLSYVRSELSGDHYRPCYVPTHKPNAQGVGMFVKGVDYAPPPTLMRFECLGHPWLAARMAGGALYPPHPSAKDWLP